MNAVTILRLDALRLVRGIRNGLKAPSVLARLRATLSLMGFVVAAAAFLYVTVGQGHNKPSRSPQREQGLDPQAVSYMLAAILMADSIRRGRTKKQVQFESWLLSCGVRETTIQTRAAILIAARSLLFIPLLVGPARGAPGADSSAVWGVLLSFGVVSAGGAVGRAWIGWTRSFRFAWTVGICCLWFYGVVALFGHGGDLPDLPTGARVAVIAALFLLAAWALARPLMQPELSQRESRGLSKTSSIFAGRSGVTVIVRDLRALDRFARTDVFALVVVSALAGMPQIRLVERSPLNAVESFGSPVGLFMTLIQTALIGLVVSEVLWDQESSSRWAFYRSAGALGRVLVTRTAVSVAAAMAWYAVVTAPTSMYVGWASVSKHVFAGVALAGMAVAATAGSAIGAAFDSSPSQTRAIRIGGILIVTGVIVLGAGAPWRTSLVVSGATLGCVLLSTHWLIGHMDLGLRRS